METFSNYKIKFHIVWNTRNFKSLFNNKDQGSHYSCVIYRGICICGADYIGQTMRNARLRWNEHENGTVKNSECAKHLNENDDHEFKWSIFFLAPKALNSVLFNQLNSATLHLSLTFSFL